MASAADPISAPSHVDSLTRSFSLVPPAAAPAIINCILASAPSISALQLFSSLLDAFPRRIKELVRVEDSKLDAEHANFAICYASSLFHLARNGAGDGSSNDVVRQLVWEVILPLLRVTSPNDNVLLNQIKEMLHEAVCSWWSLELLEETLVPFCLRLICIHVGLAGSVNPIMFHYVPAITWGDVANDLGSFPLMVVSHVLTFLLDTALRIKAYYGVEGGEQLYIEKNVRHAGDFAYKLMYALYQMVIKTISQNAEHRSFSIRILLPSVLRAFSSLDPSNTLVQGKPLSLPRFHFSKSIWECCRSLFSLGQQERLDAYYILSLYFKILCDGQKYEEPTREGFDLREEQEYWVEVRRGLVDKDTLARKSSLYFLKLSLGQWISCFEPEACTFSATLSASTPTNGYTGVANVGSANYSMTKKEKWAEKEARSLRVGEFHDFNGDYSGRGRWKAFFLLYEMLEEYGTHLVEAAWTHQVYLFFQYAPQGLCICNFRSVADAQMETLEGMFSWLAVLWERGLFHENPQVRCLILQSILSIDWESNENYAKQVPDKFILGPFIHGLNDPVHHKDFGLKGNYISKTIHGAAKFLSVYSFDFSRSARIAFLCRLAAVTRQESFGRTGLMALAFCLSSVACRSSECTENNSKCRSNILKVAEQEEVSEIDIITLMSSELLEVLGIVIQRSKQHFNPKYRLKVCEQVIHTACSVINISEPQLDVLLHFLSNVPNEFMEVGGSLQREVQEWFNGSHNESNGRIVDRLEVLRNICAYPTKFITRQYSSTALLTFDDDDLTSWGLEAQRWARVFFLVVSKAQHFESIFVFLKDYGSNICKDDSSADWVYVKFLIVILKFIEEFKEWSSKSCHFVKKSVPSKVELCAHDVSIIHENFRSTILILAEEVKQFACSACTILWSRQMVNDADVPSSVKGKLGGPSQRRLSAVTTTAVLEAILSMEVVSSVFTCHLHVNEGTHHTPLLMFLWNFIWCVIDSSKYHIESSGEIQLAAYEALVPVLRALSSTFSLSVLDILCAPSKCSYKNEDMPFLDNLLCSFVENINNVLVNGVFTRSRRAILMDWKWLCLYSILAIPYNIAVNGVRQQVSGPLFSDASLRRTMIDLIESLENAGESSALPMLRSLRLIFGILSKVGIASLRGSPDDVNSKKVIQKLVHSSWVLHVNCNKRRVAPIAALLSAVLHPTLFHDCSLHLADGNKKGPLKWFIEQLLEEGTKSPRTIRLAACHLTGLWFLFPRTIKYYMKELKLLSLYGSVAFDEDFEAELSENVDAKLEVSFLSQSPHAEFAEAFINTEMYARVSVAILFFKLAKVANKEDGCACEEDAASIRSCGKAFLMEMLTSAINDTDIAKELYKKYSGVHRRKVRAWQMICVLSCYVDDDIVDQVTSMLHLSLYRNNLPAVRQYLEIFAIQIYLKFPLLIEEQLIPIFRDYNMKPQALSSYVFVAANVIIHAGDVTIQMTHLKELLPPIIPLLTSHHHSLRGFAQVLVYHVLCKMAHVLQPEDSEILEKKCFEELKWYLANNVDCSRLRASIEGFFDSFDPRSVATPAGIFNPRNEASDFECLPVSLMEQLTKFLDVVREDLRCSMAKDFVSVRNEIFDNGACIGKEIRGSETVKRLSDVHMDFQKKLTLHKHERQPSVEASNQMLHMFEFPNSVSEMENEDLLLSQVAMSRSQARDKFRESRQQFILVASLLDRIPNLAGLARTCEVFKATSLVVADTSVTQDKQFQLISVTAEKWIPLIEVPVNCLKVFLEKKRLEGFSILGLEQTANSTPLDQYSFPRKTVMVLGREKEGIPVDIIHVLDECIEIPQLGVIRSLNVHVSGAIALWEYTRQQRREPTSLSKVS